MVAEFKLTFKGKLGNEEALAPLKEGIKDGNLGSLSVDPKSLEIKVFTEGNRSCSNTTLHRAPW